MMYHLLLLMIPLAMGSQHVSSEIVSLSPSEEEFPAVAVVPMDAEISTKPNGTNFEHLSKLNDRVKFVARSCKELRDRYDQQEDGLYYLTTTHGTTYQTFCDMTTAGGGWTLVASVHENNMFYGKCTVGDRWSSQQGNNPNLPEGDGNWANRNTFGTAEGATSDDFKNPGYYDIVAEDLSVWHVPNNSPIEHWNLASILRYHTERRFFTLYGGNLHQLFKNYPVRYNVGSCSDKGPSIPMIYDFGDRETTKALYGRHSRNEFEPGFITFRAINHERAAMAICSGVKPTGCHNEHYCIGGGGYFADQAPNQCGDFTGLDGRAGSGYTEWRASKEMIEASVLLYYR